MRSDSYQSLLQQAGLAREDLATGTLNTRTPIDGSSLGHVALDGAASIDRKIAIAQAAFLRWRLVPPPSRAELLRSLAARVRALERPLAQLITLETGKIAAEALAEVRDIAATCEFAIGLSRQLHGLTMASEHAGHHLQERWLPLGPVGVISAFNFPMSVWAWNAVLALLCGDSVLWKPSEQTPLCALALHRLLEQAMAAHDAAPAGLSQLVLGDGAAGAQLAAHGSVPLVSATGSTAMGRSVATAVAARLGRSLLELGGNNAAIIAPSADAGLALRHVVAAATATCGQRCTTLRRLYMHRARHDELLPELKRHYAGLTVGNPLDTGTAVGPLISANALEHMQAALASARSEGARITGGEAVSVPGCAGGRYVRPAIVELDAPIPVMRQETFAPILYVLAYDDFDSALAQQNSVSQGLSSALFSSDLGEVGAFLSASGSDCGIANVNLGTCSIEVGAAFGGEKDTGGGREAGSDSWKSYMRRQTQSVNFGDAG